VKTGPDKNKLFMKLIDKKTILQTISKAQQSERKRMNYNYHLDYTDPINRLLNAMEPGTYVQPHKHENPDKREIFIILEGSVAVICFDDKGRITGHIVLDHKKGSYGVEIPERLWHMVISLETGTVMYEVKDGPYAKMNDKNFATWAPKEGDEGCDAFLQKILKELNILPK
jgi:cupin fold WbuC family metalloprotein